MSVAGRIVDADQPVLEALGQAQRSSEVTCVHVGAEAVGRGVGRVSSRATAISSVASSSTVGTQKKPRDQTPSVSGWPHDAAPGCRGRRDLAGDHRGREVPGRDRGDRPDGLAQHPRALAGVRRRHPLAGDAPGLLGKPPEVRDRASSNGLPFSVVMRRARTSRRFSINDWMFSSA